MGTERGQSMLELLIAQACFLVLTMTMVMLLGPSQRQFMAEPEAADMQQRLRVGVDVLSKDLRMAGAGAYQGATSGPFGYFFAPILPFRFGLNGASPGSFKADTVSVIYVPPVTAAQTTTGQALPARSTTIAVVRGPGCPVGDPSCGFTVGMSVLAYDETASRDLFTVESVQGSLLQLRHVSGDSSKVYASGTPLVQVIARTYYALADARTDTYQLARYDGKSSDAAVLDHAVGFELEYYGETQPPLVTRPVSDPVGPWTTYGPKPPLAGVRTTDYPAGENCVFSVDVATGYQVPRLPMLGDGTASTLVRLTPQELTDGPWCPDPTMPNRFDADLLRIRRVVVTLRVESALSALRGPASLLFRHPGTSSGAHAWLPDQELRFSVSPPNLGLSR